MAESGKIIMPFIRGRNFPLFIWGLLCFLCIAFIVFPLLSAARETSAADWIVCVSSPRWRTAMCNTLLSTALSTLISVVVGYIYAYAVTRGGVPFARFFSFFPVLHLVTPPFVGGLAFILLFGRNGLITDKLLSLQVSLYGLPGLLIAQTLCFFPIAFLVIRDSLANINSSLEQAARGLGAGCWKIFISVTLPLSCPGIISAALFIAISVLSDFGNPMLAGGRFRVLAVEIYTQLSGWAKVGESAVLALMLLIPALLLFALQRYMLWRRTRQFAVIGTRSAPLPVLLPPFAVRCAFTVFCSVCSLVILVHYAVIAGGAFSKIWGVDASFTAEHIKSIAKYGAALKNSLAFAFCASAAAVLLASIISYFIVRTRFPFRKMMDTVVMLPAAIPGPLMGLAFVLAFNSPPFKLTGTRIIVIAAMIVSYLPVSCRMMISSISQIRETIDESARSLGAGLFRVYSGIILPLISRGAAASFVFCFVQAAGTLSTVIFLVSFKTPLASVSILNLAEQGDWSMAAALAFVLTLSVFFVLGIYALASRLWFLPQYAKEERWNKYAACRRILK